MRVHMHTFSRVTGDDQHVDKTCWSAWLSHLNALMFVSPQEAEPPDAKSSSQPFREGRGQQTLRIHLNSLYRPKLFVYFIYNW